MLRQCVRVSDVLCQYHLYWQFAIKIKKKNWIMGTSDMLRMHTCILGNLLCRGLGYLKVPQHWNSPLAAFSDVASV